jgi:hypothetical protein
MRAAPFAGAALALTLAMAMAACGAPPRGEGGTTRTQTHALGTTYQVGPSRTHKKLQDVQSLLAPGDIAEVDYSATPYPAGVNFQNDGTAANPITIRGIPDGLGRRPVIKAGINQPGEANMVHFNLADHYVFENMELDGSANQGNGWDGTVGTFRCVFHHGGFITIRNTYVHDCPAQGILGAEDDSGPLTIEHSEIARCGSGDTRHAIYMSTDMDAYPGAVFRLQHSYVHDGNGGNLVKSRAERNEIYYNWIENAFYRELELIGRDLDTAPPRPMHSDVVGNVISKPNSASTSNNARVGHDWQFMGTAGSHGRYRFVNNTFVLPSGTTASSINAYGALESVEMHNNVFFRVGGQAVSILRTAEADWTTGSAQIAGQKNWVTTGSTVPTQWTGTLLGTNPGFLAANDYRLADTSPLRDQGTTSAPGGPPGFPFPGPLYPPAFVPPLHAQSSSATARPVVGTIDIGAYEHGGGGGCSYALNPTSASPAAAGGAASVAVTAGVGCAWSASSGASWVTITAGASGAGNGTVSYSVAANGAGARSGSLTIAGLTFPISQAAGGAPGGLPSLYLDETNVTFVGGTAGVQAAVAPGEGLGGTNAVKHSALQIWDATKRMQPATPVDISAVLATDKLRISLDVSAGRVSQIYVYFNNDWQTFLVSPVLDQSAGYQTFDLDIGSTMRAQMGNTITDVYFKAGDGFPDNGTLWVDEMRFIRP